MVQILTPHQEAYHAAAMDVHRIQIVKDGTMEKVITNVMKEVMEIHLNKDV
jgi:hypothetical protein